MGNTSSADGSKPLVQYGCHILHVQPGSPGEACGLKAYFDLVLSAQGIHLDKEKEEGRLVEILKANLHQPVRLMVYDLKTETLREVAITPSDTWGGAGVAGITIRYCSSESALDTVWHLLEVQPNSPASKAGLKKDEDYIIGTHNALLQDAEDLYKMIAAYEGKNLALFVYNTVTDNTRLVNLVPDKSWGGQGSIGCTFGSGYLHRIPRTKQAMASSDAHHGHSHKHGGHDHSHSHSHNHGHSKSHSHDDHSHDDHSHDDHSHDDDHSHKHDDHSHDDHSHDIHSHDDGHSHKHGGHDHSHSHHDRAHDHHEKHSAKTQHLEEQSREQPTHVDEGKHSDHNGHSHSHGHSHDEHSHSHSHSHEEHPPHPVEEAQTPRGLPPMYEEVSVLATGSSVPPVTPKKNENVTPPQSPGLSFVQTNFQNLSILSPIDHPEFQPQPIPPFSPIFAQPPTESDLAPETSLQEIPLDESQ